MCQRLLAHEMEKAHELGADIVSLLHISPARNLDFRKITSPRLEALGSSATDVRKTLITPPDCFIGVSTESLFGPLDLSFFLNCLSGGLIFKHPTPGWTPE